MNTRFRCPEYVKQFEEVRSAYILQQSVHQILRTNDMI